MKNKSKLFLIIGIVCLLVGGYLYLSVDGDAVNQQNLEIMQTATNAQEAAQQISANNRGEVGGNALAMLLLGFGAMMTIGSVILMAKKEKQPA